MIVSSSLGAAIYKEQFQPLDNALNAWWHRRRPYLRQLIDETKSQFADLAKELSSLCFSYIDEVNLTRDFVEIALPACTESWIIDAYTEYFFFQFSFYNP